jgi:hypothetical protein
LEVGLVPEEQDDASVIHGPRERLSIGVGACRAGLHAGVEELAVAHDLAPAVPQAALERLDGDEAHEPPRLGGGDLRLGRARGEGARVEEESVGRGGGGRGRGAAAEEEAGGGSAPQGHGAVVVEEKSRQRAVLASSEAASASFLLVCSLVCGLVGRNGMAWRRSSLSCFFFLF